MEQSFTAMSCAVVTSLVLNSNKDIIFLSFLDHLWGIGTAELHEHVEQCSACNTTVKPVYSVQRREYKNMAVIHR